MADANDKTAYIKTERADGAVRYIAKVFHEPPCQITKAQYNQIVKSLKAQDWRVNEEDETLVISRIIANALKPTEPEE